MYFDLIGNLYAYAIDRYKPPKLRWEKRKFEIRCYEIYTYEKLIALCYDNPFRNPKDILEDQQLEIEFDIIRTKNNPKRQQEFIAARNVINSLLNVI